PAGIKRVINGPFTFSPDGNPWVGPVQGLKNFWCACAVMAGFSQGGGVGLALSQWMVNGDPGFDVWAMDIARFGEWATRSYTNEKVRENYSRRFSIRFPNEELPAARPQQTTALYDVMRSQGAVMGDSWGLETPLWFGPKAVEAKDMGLVGLSIAGPKSRDVLQKLTDEDVSKTAFKFMDHRAMDIANVPAMINRVTYTGDLGYEIWVAPEYQRKLYRAIMEAGRDLGIVNFGMRALLSLRLEKNFPTWFR